jgi:hypothetical protein
MCRFGVGEMGSILEGMSEVAKRELRARIFRKVDVDLFSGCWLYCGRKVDGYCQVRIGGKFFLVHRVVYELEGFLVLPGRELDHVCRVRHCCNPAHLEPVTHLENVRRGCLAEVMRRRSVLGNRRQRMHRDFYGGRGSRGTVKDRRQADLFGLGGGGRAEPSKRSSSLRPQAEGRRRPVSGADVPMQGSLF